MNIRKRKLKGYMVLSVLIILCVCFASAVSLFVPKESANAFSSAANAASQGYNCGELMLSGYEESGDTGNVFNETTFWNILKIVTGESDLTVSSLASWSTTQDATQFRNNNADNNRLAPYVTINGKNWTAVYLSYNTKNEPILTFWLANNATSTEARWNEKSSTSIGTYPSNMYGTSEIRAKALNNGGGYAATVNASALTQVGQDENSAWAIYTMDKSKKSGSIKEFLEVPDNMSWQHTQKAKEMGTGHPYNYNNDALDVGGTGYNYYTDTTVSTWGYQAWKNDTLWLPSIAEVGASNIGGLWRTNQYQRQTNKVMYYRSAVVNDYSSAYVLGTEGTNLGSGLTTAYAVRPAFHLNLKLAAARIGSKVGIKPPNDVNSDYNGGYQTLANVAASQKGWFDSTRIDISYPEDGIKDVGTYKMTATLTDIALSENLIFTGAIREEEDNTTTRIFYFTINKKKIEAEIKDNPNGPGHIVEPKDGEVHDDDTGDRAPQFALTYKNDDTGITYSECPTAVGKYTITATIVNDCNYELKTCTKPYEVEAREVALPTASKEQRIYKGSDYEINLENLVPADVKVKVSDGMTYTEGDTKVYVKNAGTYTITFTLRDTVNTKWSDDTLPNSVTVTIDPAPLTIEFNSDVWEWNLGDEKTVYITDTRKNVDDVLTYDVSIDGTKLDASRVAWDSANKADKKTNITIPSQTVGGHTLSVSLAAASGSNANGNYTLTTKTQTFTIKGKRVVMDDSLINWSYNNTAVGNPSEPVKLVYTGNAYIFSINESPLAACGVKIDTTKSGTTNGYGGDVSATNARTTAYSVTVYLTNLDDTFETYNKTYTLSYRIDKAKYDLSGLSWPSVNELEYNGKPQGVELLGVLPAGLQVASYSGNGNIPVAKYTTTVTFSVASTHNNNYEVPTANNTDTYDGDFDFSFDWYIIQATLNVTWKDDNNGDIDEYTLPTLNKIGDLDVSSMVTYTYYDKDDNVITSLPKKDEVVEETRYRAVATLTGANNTNYKFATGNSVEYSFTIGKNKYAVKLVLQWNGENIDGKELTYTGSKYEPSINITEAMGGVQIADITLRYYKDGETSFSTDAPIVVGSYRIEVILNNKADDNYIDRESAEFEFEIIKADFDVSGLKWQYTHGEVTATYDFDQNKWLDGNGEEILPTYDKTAHTLTLVGKDGITNLQIDVTGNEYTDAGDSYTAQITFAYDTVNYNAPDFPTTLSWSIAKARIDASEIVWGYDDGENENMPYTEAFTYTIRDGQAVEYTLKLINVPEELDGAITYLGTQTASNKSANNLEYVLAFNNSNYHAVEMPDELQKSIRWEIKQRLLTKPENDGSWTVFDDREHNLADIFSVNEEGWENYFTISVTYNNEPFDGYVCKNAGRYNVSFILKNEDDVANVYWYEEPLPVNILNIEKLLIKIDGWTDRGANSTVILAEDEDEHKIDYLSYKYVDIEGNEVSLSSMKYNVEYYRQVIVKDGYENNVEIELGEECEPQFAFSRSDGKTMAHKPKFGNTELVYDGLTHTLSDFGISGVEEYMQVSVAQGNIKNAGEYKVTISLKYKDTYCWEDGTVDDFEVILTVNKYQLPTNWEINGGKPKFVLPENLNDNVELEYAYFDEDGVEVAGKDLKSGVTYNVVAKLKDKYSQNYEFVDGEGQSLETSEKASFVATGAILSDEEQDEPPKSSIDFGKILDAVKENWQPILSIVSMLFALIFIGKGMGYAGKRKKVKKTIDKRYTAYYAISGVGLFGLPNTTWTMIACIMAGVAVLALIFMLLQKRMYNKALEDMEDAKEEYNRTMFMSGNNMNGGMSGGMGMGQAGVVYAQPQFALEDMRGMINEAMSNMLPNVTQYLPQEASYNEEIIQQLIDQNAQNEERIRQLTEENEERIRQLTAQNDELMRNLAQGQEMLMQKFAEEKKETVSEEVIEKLAEKLAKQQAIEKEEAEKEAAATLVNEKTIEELKETIRQEVQSAINTTAVKTVEKDIKDEKIEMLMRNQEMLMRQMMDMASRNNDKQIVMPYMQQPSERLMEKMIELTAKSAEKTVEKIVPIPVEKIVEKEVKVEVPVEKIVEKEVVKEVPVPVEVEKIVEVEKVVEKVVPMPIEKPAKESKAPVQRLTLDEAYAKLTASQKKIFDTLKNYALSKDKCKENKSTYFTVLGQSSVNPLVKLTIKKNTTVALFKMEDEYFKDIRRSAGSDGTKVKVKETEVVVGDNQALATAKDMIDLREDQIERYNDYLKEQKAMRKK